LRILESYPLLLALLASPQISACSTAAGIVDSRADTGDGPSRDSATPDSGCGPGVDGGAELFDPSGPLKDLRQSILSLRQGWRFKTDPGDSGAAAGWALPTLDDSGWALIDAGRCWEEQGFAGYDGVAWYRQHVTIPAGWQGSPVSFISDGVDDEYDLYVNGAFVAHFGQPPSTSVYLTRTQARIDGGLKTGDNLVALRVKDWGSGGGLCRAVAIRQSIPLSTYQDRLPSPILDGDPSAVQLYWEAWRMAWEKVSFGTAENGFAAAYMDEGFNDEIFQWDSSFITLFGRYGLRLFPVMATLDNFYLKQRADGYIQRVYSEADGKEVQVPTESEPMINPPLFSWVELAYYRFSGDASRLPTVLPRLERHYAWLKDNIRHPLGKGLYFQTDLGSGMDNTPRGDVAEAAWADMSLQQALNARSLASIARVVGDAPREKLWTDEHQALKGQINALLWNAQDGMHYDLLRSGALAKVKHIGAFWALIAEVVDASGAAALVAHLQDAAEFYRPHLFPTLAASEPTFVAAGNYWRGSVWAPTNYMVIKGLGVHGYRDLAREAAASHLKSLIAVYASPPTDPSKIAPEERDGDYKTIWECYSSELVAPCTRWDNTYFGRQDFVGWSGLGPIALLIEEILGIEVDGVAGSITWRMTRVDRHGVERLQLGASNLVDLVAAARATPNSPATIAVSARRGFGLTIERPGQTPRTFAVCAGKSTLVVP
jgi:hypothetical protein